MTIAGHNTHSGQRYRPILALGQGGMAEVHLAVARGPSGFNKLVVLKSMRRHLVPDAELRQMFLGEARLSARLNHTNVVQVYEVLDNTLPCIVMEYLEGQAMSAVQEAGGERFTMLMQLRVIADALEGLHYSHELRDYDGTPLNIVHRDVSPHNVFITYEGLVKILDFGVAKATNVAAHTRTGVIKGKIAYMPREQMLGEELDRRADIYAIGCMLWQAVTGVKLWAKMPERDIMRRLIEGDIPAPSTHCAVDPELEAIVMKALAGEPENRYATALELRTELDRYLTQKTPGCSMREVAKFVSELFQEQRGERAKAIHTSVSAASSAPPALEFGEELGTGTFRGDRSATGADGNSGSRSRKGTNPGMSTETAFDAQTESRRPPKPDSTRTFAVLLAAAALFGAAGYMVMKKLNHEAPPKPVAAAPQRTMQLRISVTPAEASVTIDGKPQINPAVLSAPMDTLDHELRAELPGYAPFIKSLRYDRDVSLDVALQKLEPAPAPVSSEATNEPKSGKPGHSPGVRPRPMQGTRPPGATDSCDPPFFFREGIKVYKPGCI